MTGHSRINVLFAIYNHFDQASEKLHQDCCPLNSSIAKTIAIIAYRKAGKSINKKILLDLFPFMEV